MYVRMLEHPIKNKKSPKIIGNQHFMSYEI